MMMARSCGISYCSPIFPAVRIALVHCAGVLNLAFKMEGHMTFHLERKIQNPSTMHQGDANRWENGRAVRNAT